MDSLSPSPTSTKLVIIGALIAICLVPTLFVGLLLSERENRQIEATSEISEKWGPSQIVAGPVLFLPYHKTTIDAQGVRKESTGSLNVLPQKLNYNAAIDPEVRSRGIFDAVVYKTLINGVGEFQMPDFSYLTITPSDIDWSKAYVAVGISDTRGITEKINLRWNGSSIAFEPGPKNYLVGANGIHAFTPLISGEKVIPFTYSFTIQGSEKLEFVPLGNETKVEVKSSWKTPSFSGIYLPKERALDDGFSASWSISSFGRSYPQQWLDEEVGQQPLMDSRFGVSLIQGVDFYTQISRTIKYAIMFIAITFLAFFLFEILSKLRIHPFQYLLIGFSLALFYLLLLSLSERIGFLAAYAISTLATIGLITSYSAKVLRAHKKALIVAALLLLLYSYLYIIVQLEDLALLFGSILLFILLALTMYLTRNIDWYHVSSGERKQ